MNFPHVNYLAVLVAGIAIFVLGGLWYSKALFAKRWIALHGWSDETMNSMKTSGPPMGALLGFAFVSALVTAWTLAVVLNHFQPVPMFKAVAVAVFCWLGFAGVTSLQTSMFSMHPKGLWIIDSGYTLVSFIVAALVLDCWP